MRPTHSLVYPSSKERRKERGKNLRQPVGTTKVRRDFFAPTHIFRNNLTSTEQFESIARKGRNDCREFEKKRSLLKLVKYRRHEYQCYLFYLPEHIEIGLFYDTSSIFHVAHRKGQFDLFSLSDCPMERVRFSWHARGWGRSQEHTHSLSQSSPLQSYRNIKSLNE